MPKRKTSAPRGRPRNDSKLAVVQNLMMNASDPDFILPVKRGCG